MSYLKRIGTRRVPQSAPIPDSGQVPNSAGGFAWAVDSWTRLRRFLVLGSEGGSYYASESKLTRKNAKAVARLPRGGRARAVAEIVRVSRERSRAEERSRDLRARDGCGSRRRGDTEGGSRGAAARLPNGHAPLPVRDVRRGLPRLGPLAAAGGRPLVRRAEVDALAYQAVKYRQREGVTHRDLLRLAHPADRVSAGNPTLAVSAEHARLFEWIVRGGSSDGLPRIVEGFARAHVAGKPQETAELVREYRLPREAVKTEHLASPVVWEALLEEMPMTALIRNLATMTRVGLLDSRSAATARRGRAARRRDRIRRARVHPITVLAALRTYASGRGARGRNEWRPVRRIVDALDAAFYTAFGNVTPTGKRLLLALDVSGSMESGWVAGIPGLSPRDASAALALVTAATEQDYEIVGFYAGRGGWKAGGRRQYFLGENGITPLSISPRQRLDDAVKAVSDLPFGGTDCALPMLYAQAKRMEIDTFVIFTDSETWAGNIHPANALRDYRRASGIDARLVVVGMVSNGFSIADPTDPGMLDVVGFDTATPQLISDFARGEI